MVKLKSRKSKAGFNPNGQNGGPLKAGAVPWAVNFLVLLICAANLKAATVTEEAPTVGMEGRLQVVLPGPELEPKPVDKRSAVLVRIAGTRPHGTLVYYDLRYVGLEPGEHDLREYLVSKDGSTPGHLPPLSVRTSGLLPERHSGWLIPEAKEPVSLFARYRLLIGVAGLIWLGLAVPLYFWRRSKPLEMTAAEPAAAPGLADRLRVLIEAALQGTLSSDGQAQLERLMINYWRERLGLEGMTYEGVLARLKTEAEAGRVLRQVEDWLHRPPGSVRVDLREFLEPYRTAAGCGEDEERENVGAASPVGGAGGPDPRNET